MVDYGLDHGRSVLAAAGVAAQRRKTLNGSAIIAKMQERRVGPQDAISGWTPS